MIHAAQKGPIPRDGTFFVRNGPLQLLVDKVPAPVGGMATALFVMLEPSKGREGAVMTLADRIQQLRKQKGISQEELADRVGVSRQAVSKWESDGGVPELDTLIAMSRLFHVTIGQLLGVEELRKSGVGSGEDGGQTQVGTGLHEAQVEAILRRYVESCFGASMLTSRPSPACTASMAGRLRSSRWPGWPLWCWCWDCLSAA